MVLIFKVKDDIRNCSCYGAVKCLGHGMKVMERVLVKRFCTVVSVDEIQFSFMPERGTIGVVFILRRMHELYQTRGKKLCICFVDLEKAFDRVLRNVLEWAMRKKEIPEVLVRSVMSLYEGARPRVRVGSELSDMFLVNVWLHQESVLSPFLFAVVVDVVTEFAREGALSELLYDLFVISGTIEGLRNKFIKWKEVFESMGSKVNLGKTKVKAAA